MDLASVIIVNWNGMKFLPECLESLRQQAYRHFSIILVDNGSNDGSIDFVIRNYPEVKTIALPKNVGFSVANNIAIKTVHTEYVALLNNDAVAHPLWLQRLMGALEEHPEAGFAASKMLFYDNPRIIDRTGDGYTRAGTGLLRGRGEPARSYNKQELIFGACAGAVLYRTRMLRDTGLFDEDFFLLYEDVDLSFRAQLQGYKCIYVPDAVVYHKASASIGYDSAISVYYSHRNLEWVYIQNMPAGLILKTIFPHIIYDIAAFFFFTARGRNKDFIKAKWDALKGIKKALKKRKQIQKNRTVEVDYIWRLLERELFFTRLIRRLKTT
ncbi:MAG: glycosyltransferase family 2 protein [Deltaproteobacteria bacterium]|nr:glycosyltransferase family 2 protein [Deltaproteobacteria bacterium]